MRQIHTPVAFVDPCNLRIPRILFNGEDLLSAACPIFDYDFSPGKMPRDNELAFSGVELDELKQDVCLTTLQVRLSDPNAKP